MLPGAGHFVKMGSIKNFILDSMSNFGENLYKKVNVFRVTQGAHI